MNASVSTPTPVVIDLSFTFGVFLISTFIACALWGATCLQTGFYFATYASDPLHYKLGVTLLWIADTAHQVVITKSIWTILVPHFGDPLSLVLVDPIIVYEPLPKAVVALIAQAFFTWRIWTFSRHRWIFPIVLAPMILWQAVGSIVYIVMCERTPKGAALSKATLDVAYGINAVAAAVDVAIAVCMCVMLYQKRSGMRSTDRMVYRLIVSSFNTGIWSALFALLTIILLVTRPNDFLYSIPDMTLCALYTNSVLANLNARRYIGSQQSSAANTVFSDTSGSGGGQKEREAEAEVVSKMEFRLNTSSGAVGSESESSGFEV